MSVRTSDSSTIIVEGSMAVEAMLDSGRFRVTCLFVERNRHGEVAEKARELGIEVQTLSRDEIRAEAGFDFHRGIFARAERPAGVEIPGDILCDCDRLVLPLGIADPGNLGTVVRSAAAFGAEAILVEQGRGADIWGRKAIRASATAVFRLPVFEVPDPVEFLHRSHAAGFTNVGTSLASRSLPLSESKSFEKTLILLGAEKDGLRPEVEEACDRLVRIPMANGMDSLNVAATAAIVCHHFFASRER